MSSVQYKISTRYHSTLDHLAATCSMASYDCRLFRWSRSKQSRTSITGSHCTSCLAGLEYLTKAEGQAGPTALVAK